MLIASNEFLIKNNDTTIQLTRYIK